MPLLTPSSEDTCIYELCVLYPPLSQKEEAELLKEIEELFTEAGGKQITRDLWGNRGLAYPIKSQREGRFAVFYYDVLPEKLKELDRQIRIIPSVLRHMIIRPPKGYEVVRFSEQYETWLKERTTHAETALKEEETRLQKTVVEKARREAKRAEAQKKETEVSKPAVKDQDIEEKLEKLISDEDLGL